jgi:hypothetical protein
MILEFVRDMAKSNIYVGLEVGTSKICVVVGEVRSDGTIKILGVGTAPSRGVRKGEIVDFDTAQRCLHDALVRAEDKSDVMIRNVFLSITGPHVSGFLTTRVRLPSMILKRSRSWRGMSRSHRRMSSCTASSGIISSTARSW